MFILSLRTIWISVLFATQVIGRNIQPIDAGDIKTLVRTPGGLIPENNIHLVPDGARVHHTPTQVQIIGGDGTTLHSVLLPRSNISGEHTLSDNQVVPRAFKSGWDAQAYWTNQSPYPISFFATSWIVPEVPAVWSGQLLYYFNGLQPGSDDAILQPVLQYGNCPAGGGQCWAIGSWFVIQPHAFVSNKTRVSPGQLLDGYMEYIGESTSTFSWTSTFSVDNTPISASFLNISTTEVFKAAYETLEIYTTANATDLPTGSTTMSNIRLFTQNSSYPPSIPWATLNDTVDGLSMSITSTSSTNGSVVIHYPA